MGVDIDVDFFGDGYYGGKEIDQIVVQVVCVDVLI